MIHRSKGYLEPNLDGWFQIARQLKRKVDALGAPPCTRALVDHWKQHVVCNKYGVPFHTKNIIFSGEMKVARIHHPNIIGYN